MRKELKTILRNSEDELVEKFFNDSLERGEYNIADNYLEEVRDTFKDYEQYKEIVRICKLNNYEADELKKLKS